MADTHEELQRRIEEDLEQNSGCSYSILRSSSASTILNGTSRAETFTRIIRCVALWVLAFGVWRLAVPVVFV